MCFVRHDRNFTAASSATIKKGVKCPVDRQTFVMLKRLPYALPLIALLWGPLDPQKLRALETDKTPAVATRIQEVQLYSDQALVRRAAGFDLRPGTNHFVVAELPAALADDSVRVTVKDPDGVRIQEIRVETKHVKVFRSEQAREAEKNLREAEGRLRRLTDEYGALATEVEHLKQIRPGDEPKDKEKRSPIVNAAHFRETLDFVQSALRRTQNRVGELIPEIDQAREEMAVAMTVAERYRSTTDVSKKEIHLAVESRDSRSTSFILEYRIGGASWYPVYAARVLTNKADAPDAKAQVRLTSYALVRNETGEDWKNVKVAFSAADPEESARLPELAEWRIKVEVVADGEEYGRADDADKSVAYKDESKKEKAKEDRAPGRNRKQSPSQGPRNEPNVKPAETIVQRQQSEDGLIAGLTEEESIVQQNVDVQSKRSREFYSQNKNVVRDERAGKKSESTQKALNDIQSNIQSQRSALSRGDYERAIENGDRVVETIRRLDPKYRKHFAEDEADSIRMKNQSLRLMDSRRLTGHLISPRNSARGYDYRYQATIPETILSDGTFHKVFLSEKPLAADLLFEATPVRMPLAFLTGKVELKGDAPLLSGPVSVFHNTDYMGEAVLSGVAGGETFALHLGSDEDIRVTRTENEFRVTSGVFSKNFVFDREITLTVTNGKKKAVVIDLFDRIPYSADERITITDVRLSEKAVDDNKQGLHKFRLKLDPGKKKEITIKYKLTHPSDILPITSEGGSPQW